MHMEQGFPVRAEMLEVFFAGRRAFEEQGGANAADYDWDTLIAQFQTPTVGEEVLRQKVYQQAQKLYLEQATLEETKAAILRETQLYFAERG